MSKVDLHVHTTSSDGRFTPAQIVSKAAELHMSVIAITDHDAIDGIAPALQASLSFPDLTVIPGVEINTDVPDGEAHVLGYFIDFANRALVEMLDRLRNTRIYRAKRMVAKLGELGMPLEWARVQELAGTGSLGRPHIAQAMLEKGYIQSLHEAFDKYISRNGPAYVEREKISPAGAVEAILQASGLPVLAHPFTVPDPEALTADLKKAGLVGLEIYYAGYGPGQISRLTALAKEHGLIATGGTDFHGLGDSEVQIGDADVPAQVAEQLIALARERNLIKER